MNICIVAGARPNFIKVAPIVRAIENAREHGREIDYTLVYTSAEDDPTLEASLFDDLQIARPQVFLGVTCENLNELTGQVMSAFERYLQERKTDVVIVVDDLASTMAAAIVTKKQGITLAHIVAGTRSFDIKMPKEINRLVIDGLSDLLFTAGMGANSIATREGAELSKIYTVGNILMDTLRFNRNRLKAPSNLPQLGEAKGYLVFTLNRKALMADRENLRRMIETMMENAGGMPIIAPLRGRAKEIVSEILASSKIQHSTSAQPTIQHSTLLSPSDSDLRFNIQNSFSYLEFGWLTAHARGIITDSGNVAEEATFNGVPCITLNSYTEHIETVKVGTNELVGEDAALLGEMVAKMVRGEWKESALPDRWDGRTAERIVQILMEL
ncbi:MAG: UDP-N-acetylglucosamine 2-epimerase [Prevotella sp.]|nr:UDP-N-acetylglucosamine 2-epimerase [Prevotella sp.]